MTEQTAALDAKGRRRRSQEALDTRVSYIPHAHMMVALSAALVIAAAVYWGLTGNAPTKVAGQGLIVREGQQTFTIRSTAQGRVEKISVKEGDRVSTGQVLVEILQPELDEQIRAARRRVEDLKDHVAGIEGRDATHSKAQEQNTASQVTAASEAIAAAEQLKARIHERIATVQNLVTRGNAPMLDLMNLEYQHDEANNRIAQLKLGIEQAKASLVNFHVQANTRIADARLAVSKEEREVARLEADREETRYLRAPAFGFIAEIYVTPGVAVNYKDSLITLAKDSAGFEMLAFLDPEQGGRIAKGMSAHVVPSTVRKAEYGTMVGEVISVSEAPVSLQEMENLLGNRQLAEAFARNGQPYFSRIKLFQSAHTRSGFQWWSGKGPPFQVSVGTEATVEIVVREQRPISLVIPAVRQLLDP
jgi:HlyD family secretion protein